MMRTGWRRVFWLPVWALLAASGCGDDRPQSTKESTAPVAGGTAIIAMKADPDVLNPLIRQSADAGRVLSTVNDPLLEMTEDLGWEARIARTWSVAPDGRSVTFELRPWNWSDGHPVTARDLVVSLELFKDPRVASPRRGFFEDVAGAVALDDSTVRYDFLRPVSDPLNRTFHFIVPAHVVADLDPAAVADWPLNSRPVGTGAYLLETWDHNRQIVLQRSPHYRGRKPLLDRVVFRILPEKETRILALEAGEVDIVDEISPADAARLERSGKATVHAIGGRVVYYLQWNCRRPAFTDAATRRALSLALDRDRMVATLMGGYARPAVSPVAPALWNHHGEMAADILDQAAARSLLADAGWADSDGDGILERDGVTLSMQILTRQGDPVRENGAVMLRENLRAVGADVTVRIMEQGVVLERIGDGEFDAFFGKMNLNLYGDPSSLIHSTAVDRFNKGAFAHAGVDSLLEVALGLRNREDALPVWHALQELLQEQQPAAWLFNPEILVGVGPRLQGVRPHMLSPFNNLTEWWIAPEDRRYRSGS